MRDFHDTEEFSPQEVEAAQNDLTNVLLFEQLYNTAHNEVYPIALDLINKGKFIVTDSTLEDASYHKKCLEQGIISCKIFIVAYDGGKFTPAMKAFKATSASRREEFVHMWDVFEQALDIVKDGFLRYKLWKSNREILMKISKHGSNDTLEKLYGNSVDFEIMLHDCSFVLDAATELEFDLDKDAVLDNFVKQLKKILYDIRGEEEVEKLLNAPWREDVRAAHNALYDEHDPQKAMRLYEQAARVGSGEAMYELGQLYRHFWTPCIRADMRGGSGGHPVAKDDAKAIEWYRKAAAANYSPAMETLGSCYESGDYVIKDIYEAIRWYKKAAALGCSRAMRELARIYQEGIRVPQDTIEARRWREMPTFYGYREGIRKLKDELKSDTSVKSVKSSSDNSSPVAPWMNSSSNSSAPVKTVEKKAPVVTESSTAKSSVNEENTSNELGREDYPGLAFWVVLLGLYGFTSTDFISSLMCALVAFGLVRAIV